MKPRRLLRIAILLVLPGLGACAGLLGLDPVDSLPEEGGVDDGPDALEIDSRVPTDAPPSTSDAEAGVRDGDASTDAFVSDAPLDAVDAADPCPALYIYDFDQPPPTMPFHLAPATLTDAGPPNNGVISVVLPANQESFTFARFELGEVPATDAGTLCPATSCTFDVRVGGANASYFVFAQAASMTPGDFLTVGRASGSTTIYLDGQMISPITNGIWTRLTLDAYGKKVRARPANAGAGVVATLQNDATRLLFGGSKTAGDPAVEVQIDNLVCKRSEAF